jgi:hypothetical protein
MPPATASIAAPATVAGAFIFSRVERLPFDLLAVDFDFDLALLAVDFDLAFDFDLALLAVDFAFALLAVGLRFFALEPVLPAFADPFAFFEPPVAFPPLPLFRGFVLV